MNFTPLAFLFLLTPSLDAQVGGQYETIRQIGALNAWDGFGSNVSGGGDINNDGYSDYIIGAPGVDVGGALSAGTVYVYSGATGAILHQIEGTTTDQRLGYVISEAGDINHDGFDDFMLGDYRASPGGLTEAGSVLVFSGADGSVLLGFNGATANARLGLALANAGDVDADGTNDIITSFLDHVLSISVVHVYSGATGAIIRRFNQPWEAWGFGGAVASTGDINGDGYPDLLIGAAGSDVNGTFEVGSAFLYSGATGQQIYRFDGPQSNEYFARAVACAGDVNADGINDIILGGCDEGGVVEVRSGYDGQLLYQYLGTRKTYLGQSVSGVGDMNLDGFDDFIIGDPAGRGWSKPSKAQIYSGKDGELLHELLAGEWEELGVSVSAAGDVNGDGFPDCIAGARLYRVAGNNEGGAAVVIGLNPHLNLSTDTISASAGGVISLDLNFPPRTAFFDYKTLISSTGIGPTNYGVDIPLTADSLAIDTFNGLYPVSTYSDLHGTLDADGDSTASMTIPGGLPSAMIGNTYWFAAIAMPFGGMPENSSVARMITIVP
jgi:FG-GAP repeat